MPSLGKFQESFEKFDVDEKIVSQINEGFGVIDSKTPKKERALYFKRAVDIMEENMDSDKFQEIFEWNACCKGGSREKASKAFAKKYADLSWEEKLEFIKDVPHMGNPIKNEDGTITVHAVYYSDGE